MPVIVFPVAFNWLLRLAASDGRQSRVLVELDVLLNAEFSHKSLREVVVDQLVDFALLSELASHQLQFFVC